MVEIKRTYIIAEAGVNHNGSAATAREMIEAAADAGADAVKFQTFKADQVVSSNAPKAEYQKKTTGENESQLDMIRKLELNNNELQELYMHCKNIGLDFLSTPFDLTSLNFLAYELNLPTIKVSSGEITNAPFLLSIAKTGKQVILSTGMSTLGEVETALSVLAYGYLGIEGKPSLDMFRETYCTLEGQEALKEKVTLLQCTTEYPAPYSDVNLKAMDTLKEAFGLPVGLSDHTSGIAASAAAVARGAAVIEKHFTLDKNQAGPDHEASLEPVELKEMVNMLRQVEAVLGSSIKGPAPSEVKNINIVRKGLVAAESINKGEPFTVNNVTVKRAGGGLSPVYYWELLGRKAAKNYCKDEPLKMFFD